MSVDNSNNTYFANAETDDIGERLVDKITGYYDHIRRNGYVALWQKAHSQFYRGYFTNGEILPYDELGEKKKIFINHFRNLLEHIKVLTTTDRPVFEPRAINNDYKSLVQTKFARVLLDYYMRQEGLEEVIDGAMDHTLLGGEGFIFEEWDKNAGKIIGTVEEEAEELEEIEELDEEMDEEDDMERLSVIKREGNVISRSFHPIDVARDWDKDTTEDNHWYIVRKRVNKYELAAKYPKRRDEIINSEPFDNTMVSQSTIDIYDDKRLRDGDQVYTFIFRHERTPAVPSGRQVELLGDGTVLFDGDLPYSDISIYPIRFANKRGSNFGYTIAYDLLPIQIALDMLESIIITNQNSFGVQTITAKVGSNVVASQLADGLKLIEHHGDKPPAPMKLLSTAPEIFNHADNLIQQMETISGINSVSRGNPEASLKSGAALAMVQSMAIQFNSGLQHAYAQGLERVGTGLISMLKDYASAPRVASIAGVGSKPYLKEFTGEDLDQIDRVIVDIGNPMSKTISGKMAIADTLVERGLIDSPEQYIQMIESGRLDPMIESESIELMSIRSENETLLNLVNKEEDQAQVLVKAFFTDNHSLHIREHSGVVSSPEARNDQQIFTNVASHIQEHIDLLKSTDPAFLMLNGQQPLAPSQVAPPIPNQNIKNTPTQGQMPQPTPSGEQKIPGAQPSGMAAELPSMPNNPMTGQDFNVEDGGLN